MLAFEAVFAGGRACCVGACQTIRRARDGGAGLTGTGLTLVILRAAVVVAVTGDSVLRQGPSVETGTGLAEDAGIAGVGHTRHHARVVDQAKVRQKRRVTASGTVTGAGLATLLWLTAICAAFAASVAVAGVAVRARVAIVTTVPGRRSCKATVGI